MNNPGIKLTLIVFLLMATCYCTQQVAPIISIPIENGDFQTISSQELITQTTLIPLETNQDCIIGDEFKFLNSPMGFFILDRESVQKVLFFNEEGKFNNSIGQKGKGLGEYVRIYDALLKADTVDLLTGFPNTEVMSYSYDGTFLGKKMILETPSYAFFNDSDDNRLYYSPISSYRIYKTNNKTQTLVDSLLPSTPGSDMVFQLHPFSHNTEGSILFHEAYYDTIYEIDRQGIQAKYLLDFGNFKIDPSIGLNEFINLIQNRGIWIVSRILENSRFLYLGLSKEIPNPEEEIYHLIYHKKSNSIYRFPNQDAFASALNPAFKLTAKDELYLSLIPHTAVASAVWSNHFKSQNIHVVSDDNPIVAIINLNAIIPR